MASPSNRFDKVESPAPDAVTVTMRQLGAVESGEVTGPRSDGPPLAFGQDGSLSPLQALAIGCHMANQLARDVVVVDPQGLWRPAWGRLDA